MQRTAIDRVLDALATKVRALTHEQLAGSSWFECIQSPSSAVEGVIHGLMRRTLVARQVLLVAPLIPLHAPVLTWSPGQSDPDFGTIAWQLQSRWPDSSPVPTTAYFATLKANRLYGGPPFVKAIRPDHELHDLSLAAVYLHFVKHRPRLAATWVGEDLLEASGFRLCDVDAVIRPNSDSPELVVEFGGRYDARRVEHFHRDCEKRNRPYELW